MRPFTHKTQSSAVAEAALEKGATVHVFGAPEQASDVVAGEVLCLDPRVEEAFVVYHPRAIAVRDGWTCFDCGVTSATEETGLH